MYSYDRRAVVDLKRVVAKLTKDAERDLRAFLGSLPPEAGVSGRVSVKLDSPPARGGYGPYETGVLTLLADVGPKSFNLSIHVTADLSDGTVGVGAFSGQHALESLMSGRVTPRQAPASLNKILDRFKEWIGDEAKKVKPKPAGVTVEDVTRKLKSMRLGPGGRVQSVSFEGDGWFIEPRDRQRLDHYGNEGEGWDDEGWTHDYAEPVRQAAQKWLDAEFPKLFDADVGEKGHVFVAPTAEGKRVLGLR